MEKGIEQRKKGRCKREKEKGEEIRGKEKRKKEESWRGEERRGNENFISKKRIEFVAKVIDRM